MILTQRQTERLFPVSLERQHHDSIVSHLYENLAILEQDEKVYYDAEKDRQAIEQYYANIQFDHPSDTLIKSIQQLLQKTHTNQVRYDPSTYVYPWVDLKPDGKLTSIYSGINRNPKDIIDEDFSTSIKRKGRMENLLATSNTVNEDQLVQIEKEFPYNCEHVVPQSWFNEQQPMRGDLHHLFTCEPVCNSFRSNHPYHDFKDYDPEGATIHKVRNKCGKGEDSLFEPEYGKGAVARAMLYFLLRYPKKIENVHMEQIDIELLLDWHQAFPPDLYEQHRNQAIYEIQGNRNPFIDHPEQCLSLPGFC